MIRQGRLIAALFMGVILSACGGAKPGWSQFPVALHADPAIVNNTQSMADLTDAMNFWEDKAGIKLFDFQGASNGGTPYSGNPSNPDSIAENVIFILNPWAFQADQVGMTTTLKTGDEITSAMVMINPEVSFCPGTCVNGSTQTSQRKTFTHELGHFLGLSHVTDEQNIMYPNATPGGDLSTVTVDQATLNLLTQNR